MSESMMFWVGFFIFVILMLVLDLKVFNRKSHEVSIKESLTWTGIWIGLSLIFSLIIYFWKGTEDALLFLTGYIIEESLSMDNLFVFILVFAYFQVPASYQHKVLFYGIMGALLMRGIFIFGGVALIEQFHWTIYILGGILVYSGVKLLFKDDDDEIHPEKNPILRLVRRSMTITNNYEGDRFFIKQEGKWVATPLFVVVVVIETTDVIFAVDSVPAILAITTDPFIVYTSNIFAILGLRALFFALSGVMQLFHYLKYGLSIVLVFVGVKMLLVDFYKMPTGWALGIVGGVLALSVAISIFFPPKEEEEEITPETTPEKPSNPS